MFSVLYVGDYDYVEADSVWEGRDFDSLADAESFFASPVRSSYCGADTRYVVLDGPGVHRIRCNPEYDPTPRDAGDWKREAAMQAAMIHGVRGWNDYYGG